jgi:antitoxin Phd
MKIPRKVSRKAGYTFSEARQKLATVLEEAQRKGAVRIKRREGSEFEIAPVRSQASPLDVQGVDLGLSLEEIVAAVRESRTREDS